MDSQLKFAPCSSDELHKPLADLLVAGKIVRLDGSPPSWVVAGRLEKRAMMSHGVPFETVWTLAELESVGIDLTVAGVTRTLGSTLEK